MIKRNKSIRNNINGEIILEKEGWKKIHVYGDPYEIGYAHGYLLSKELKRSYKVMEFLVKNDFKITMKKYIETCKRLLFNIIKSKYPDIFKELQGISDGAKLKGVKVSVDFLIASNSYMSLYEYFTGKSMERCSAFIACGDATENNDIVMAHNTHTDFGTGQLLNIVMIVTPSNGIEFTMQTSPGFVASSSDWFITKAGIVGCETTMHSVKYNVDFGVPYFCRVRSAMQYCENLDQYSNVMLKNNAGDYPCSWLFGDLNKKEIMLLEIGLNYHNKQKKTNGVFYGSNTVMSKKLRVLETNDTSHIDDNDSCGARSLRLNYLLMDKYYGKINLENSKKIISDHFDSHFNKINKQGRCICVHYEEDPLYGYTPAGCTDGKILNTELAKKLNFYGRFGSCCGRKLIIKDYIKKNPQYEKWGKILEDFKSFKWIKL